MGIKEIWKPINGYEGIYEVSNYGYVRTLERPVYRKDGRLHYIQKPKTLKRSIFNTGYYYISMHKPNCKIKVETIHRIVAEAFIDNPKNKRTVNHIDGNKLNNHIDNLEWATDSENIQHAYDNKLMPNCEGLLATNIETGDKIFFKKVIDAVKRMGFSQAGISATCIGKQKSHRGYKFEYIKSIN